MSNNTINDNMSDKEVRVAIIGAGQRGKSFAIHLPFMDNVRLTAICELNEDRLETFINDKTVFGDDAQATKNALKRYDNFDQLLADDLCDAVIITVPDKDHRAIAEKAFAAGKHCLLEKPMATNVADCRAIIAAHKQSNCILQVGFVLRSTPFYKKIKSIVDSGVLGQIMSISASEFLSVPHSVSYMRRWHRKKANCGSFMLTKCSHDLDILSWLIGSKPTRVSSFGGNDFFLPQKQPATHCSICPQKAACSYEFTKQSMKGVHIGNEESENLSKYDFDLCVYNNDKDIVDNQITNIEYENNIRAQFSLQCFYPYESERKIRINGSEGYLDGRFCANKIVVIKNDNGAKTVIDFTAQTAGACGHNGGDKPFLKEFINCIITRREPSADLHAGLNCTILAMAIDESLLSGQVVTV
ncbi:MAG: Gfo/Idh/MocA family oxidoreductase [Victivallaceae bacterium]|nr:Gfo/Idh/MocA family oxidoreductase [Victivallaceae bacterium]